MSFAVWAVAVCPGAGQPCSCGLVWLCPAEVWPCIVISDNHLMWVFPLPPCPLHWYHKFCILLLGSVRVWSAVSLSRAATHCYDIANNATQKIPTASPPGQEWKRLGLWVLVMPWIENWGLCEDDFFPLVLRLLVGVQTGRWSLLAVTVCMRTWRVIYYHFH